MKKVNVYFILQIIIICFLFSCKKKETEKVDTNNNQPIVEPTEINGVFTIIRQLYLYHDTLMEFYSFNRAVIYDTLINVNNSNITKGIEVGKISANGLTFKQYEDTNFEPMYYFYQDSTDKKIEKPTNWVISGSSNFNFLQFTDYTPYPSYTGYSILPDTIDVNKNNVINLSSFTGVDKIEIQLSNNSASSIQKTILPSVTSVTFFPIDLNSLPFTNDTAVRININFYKNTFKYIHSKIYQLETVTYFWSDLIYLKK